MGTQFPEVFDALAREFHPDNVKTRSQGGKSFDYVTARTVMNRLDEVLGPENWWDEYIQVGDNGVLCKLTIRIIDETDGSVLATVTKQDAGGFAGMSDAGDDEKSGYSDALKRAAVKFGIGRYLYGDGVVRHGDGHRPGNEAERIIQDAQSRASASSDRAAESRSSSPPQQPSRQTNYDIFRLPQVRPGKRVVFAWAKSLEEHFKLDIVQSMNEIAKDRGYPRDFGEWTQEQANDVCKYIALWISGTDHYKGEFSGKIDLESVPDERAFDHGRAKELMMAIINNIREAALAANGRAASDQEVRSYLDHVSAFAADKTGHKGAVVERLNDCRDIVWLENMLKVTESDLKEIRSRAAERVAPDDIPF